MMKKLQKYHTIFLSLGIVIMLLTFLAVAICYFNYPEALNFFSVETLFPLTMFLLFISVISEIYHDRYVFFMHGMIRTRFPMRDPKKAKDGYWKSQEKRRQESESYIEKRYRRWKTIDKPVASYIMFIASFITPFIFFFSDNVKIWVGGSSLAISVVAALVIPLILGAKTLRDRSNEKKEAERLRKEQEKREEMGRWK